MLKDKEEYCKSLLEYLGTPSIAVSVLFVTRNKNNDSYEVFMGNLSEEVATNLKGLSLRICKKSYSKPEKKRMEPYDPAQKDSSCTEFINGSGIEDIKPILHLVNSQATELKRINKDFLDDLWFYVLKFDNGNKQALFFKKYSRSMVLTKGYPLAFVFSSGDFDKLNRDVFVITDKIDCIYFRDILIIRSKGNFEKIFNFLHKIKKNAESAIGVIEDKLPFKIENLEQFKTEWLNHEIMIRKLNNIFARKTLEKIKVENILKLIKEGILKNVTLTIGKDGKLSLSSDNPWILLNILDDDYVQSLLTEIKYEAPNKKEIGGSSA